MFSYIKGTIEEIEEDAVVIDHEGIGFHIFVPGSVMKQGISCGMDIKMFTYFQVREDAFVLYGFLDKDTLKIFRQLITVNGIGPKGALSILSVLTVEDLQFAIAADDAKAIAAAPGIGVKTAQRVIIDLKDKIDLSEAVSSTLDQGESNQGAGSARNDVILALTSLGYSSSEALKAMQKIDGANNMETEELLKETLKKLTLL